MTTNTTNTYSKLVNDLLLKVQKPGQYLGIELGHMVENVSEYGSNGVSEYGQKKKLKKFNDAKATLALIYPDLYELGMANFGTKILYQIINSHPDFICDRAYAPMKDMDELLRKEKTSLWGWESFEPLNKFDFLGFSLSYELSYTNVLNILELSHLEVLSSERKELFPLVFAGGPTTFNPEPMAEFFDFFIIGDGEEVIIEILELIKEEKGRGLSRQAQNKNDLLLKLAQIPGIYVPKFYSPEPDENYLPKLLPEFKGKLPEKIIKRVVNLSDLNQPTSSPIPYLASVQDRQVMEIRRGCDRGCRFCQPGYVYLPVRERTPDDLVRLSTEALKNTGYDEYSLLSLSASDYTKLHEVASKLNGAHCSKGVSLSMPSQRADRFDMRIANELNSVRKSGITLAPEAGTERLREVVNKGLKEIEIKQAIENVYDSGFKHVKLYFMIGLPTEERADLDGIINLLKWASDLSKIKGKRPLEITCTISTFVPKSFTPFQWLSQTTQAELRQKINYLKQRIKELRLRTVKLNCTDPKIALLEVVMSRGDRRISKLIYKAYKKGAKFDAWDESLDMNLWHGVANELGIDLSYEASKVREIGSSNPWEVIDSGLLKKFLIEEWKKATEVVETVPCTENTCHACGVCFELDVLNLVSEDKSKNNKFVKTIPQLKEDEQSSKKEISILEPPCNDTSKNSKKHNLPVKSVQKIEIVHTKTANLRFISHLDVQRLFERALRRAEIPVAYTEGFNPRPKMQWLMPLPIYYESNYEVMHLELSESVEDLELLNRLNSQLPHEFQIKSVKTLNLHDKLPNVENIKVLYRILTCYPYMWEKYICETEAAIKSFLSQKFLILKVFKKRQDQNSQSEKQIDLRPLVERLEVLNTTQLELEIVISGNTRAELVLNQIMPEVIKTEFQKNNSSEWQNIWKISREMIVTS